MRKLLKIGAAIAVAAVLVGAFLFFNLADRISEKLANLPHAIIVAFVLFFGLFIVVLSGRRRGMMPRTSA